MLIEVVKLTIMYKTVNIKKKYSNLTQFSKKKYGPQKLNIC